MKSITLPASVLCATFLTLSQGIAKPLDRQAVLKALDENHARMVQAFVDRDEDAFASCWAPDAVCLAEELPLLQGKDQLCNVFLDAVSGASMHGLEKLDRRIWESGDFVYETGVYVHRYALTGREQVQSNAKSFLTVWKKQPDGSWKRAAEAWNNQPFPSLEQLEEWRKLTAEDIPFTNMDSGTAASSDDEDAILARLAGIEKTFHDDFLSDDVEPAIDIYADNARLFSTGSKDWTVGQKQIRELILNSRKHSKLVGIEQDVVASGGDKQMAYIVNRFHWQFKLPDTGDQVHDFYGKGLHIWQRQADGKWKILIDINNTNPPPGEAP